MSRPYRIELLAAHDRMAFASGSAVLDRYLQQQAKQDMRRRLATCFVAIDGVGSIAGYYTIAASSLVLDMLPADQVKRLPRYPAIPAVLLGRLAVDRTHQGQRLGSALVADAILRASRSEVAAYAMVVDAKDDVAAQFYEYLGFARLVDDQLRLLRAL